MSPTSAIVRLCFFRDTHTEADGQKLDDSVYIDGIPWRGGWGCNQEEHFKDDHMMTWDCLCCYRGSRCYFNCLWRMQMHLCNCGGGSVSVLLLLALTPAALLLAGSGDCLLGTDKNHVSQRVWNDFCEWSPDRTLPLTTRCPRSPVGRKHHNFKFQNYNPKSEPVSQQLCSSSVYITARGVIWLQFEE